MTRSDKTTPALAQITGIWTDNVPSCGNKVSIVMKRSRGRESTAYERRPQLENEGGC